MNTLSLDEMQFFDGVSDALEIYMALAGCIRARWPDVRVKVQKSQICFSNRYGFAYAWLAQRRIKTSAKLGVSFGLPVRLDCPRIFRAVEPYPNRWTHHVLLSSPDAVDNVLMGWIQAAYDFSAHK